MRKRFGPVLAWLVATVVSIMMATSAVSSVRDEVSTRPSPVRSPAETAAAIAVATTAALRSETSLPPDTTATTTTSSPTSLPPSSSQVPTTTSMPPSTTTTHAPTTTSTTAAPNEDQYFKSYQLVGGWVRLRVDGNRVYLVGAVPSPGYTQEIEKDGPESVVLEFHNGSHESKFHAEISAGKLVVETDEEGGHD